MCGGVMAAEGVRRVVRSSESNISDMCSWIKYDTGALFCTSEPVPETMVWHDRVMQQETQYLKGALFSTSEPVPETMVWHDRVMQQETQYLKYETTIKMLQDKHRQEKRDLSKKIKELKNDMRSLKLKNSKLKRNYETMREFGEDLQNKLQEVKEEYETQMQIVQDTLCKVKRVHVKEKKVLKKDIRALKIKNTKLKNDREGRIKIEEELQKKLEAVKEEYETQMQIVQDTLCKEKRVHVKEKKVLKNDIRALKIKNTKLKNVPEGRINIEEELRKEREIVKDANNNLINHLEYQMNFHDEERKLLVKKNQELLKELTAIKTRVPANNMQTIGGSSQPQGLQCGKEPAQRGGITGEVEVSLDSFQLIKTLGNGGFGTVILAKRKVPGGPGQLYAIKVVKKKHGTRSSSMSVILAEKEALMIASGHPFITALHCCFQNKEHFFFVMEYVSGGDLKHVLDKLQTFSEKMTQFYAAEITLALQFLHKHGILHRDLKLENILLDSDGHCRVADLGLSKLGHFHRDRTRTYCGTPFCMAPEMVQRLPYGHSVDWWALGIIIFQMLRGYPPFYCHKLEDKIVNSEVDFGEEMSVAAKSIVSRFLMKDPAQRLGTSGSVDTVRQHPFFTGIDWQALLEKRVKPPLKPEVAELKRDLTEEINELTNDMRALWISSTKLKRNYETMM